MSEPRVTCRASNARPTSTGAIDGIDVDVTVELESGQKLSGTVLLQPDSFGGFMPGWDAGAERCASWMTDDLARQVYTLDRATLGVVSQVMFDAAHEAARAFAGPGAGPNEMPADFKAFIAEAHEAAQRHGLSLAWDDARAALLVRRDPNVKPKL